MEESSYYNSDLGLLRPSPEDAESQYYPDEFYDNTSIEPIEAYSIDPTSDRLFTNVLTEDPNAYTEQEHDPIWQPRGCHTMTIQEQYEEIDRRTAQIRKTIQLFHGNLILDCPIAPRLLKEIPHAQPPERDEFTHMRYSAVTCDPALFWEEKFTLRPLLFAKPRITELLIAVTMYNEDELLLGKTLKAVMKNLKYLYSLNSNAVWGNDAWKKVVVCIISDGRVKLNLKSQALLAGLGVYQDGIAKSQVHDKAVTAHLYEVGFRMLNVLYIAE